MSITNEDLKKISKLISDETKKIKVDIAVEIQEALKKPVVISDVTKNEIKAKVIEDLKKQGLLLDKPVTPDKKEEINKEGVPTWVWVTGALILVVLIAGVVYSIRSESGSLMATGVVDDIASA